MSMFGLFKKNQPETPISEMEQFYMNQFLNSPPPQFDNRAGSAVEMGGTVPAGQPPLQPLNPAVPAHQLMQQMNQHLPIQQFGMPSNQNPYLQQYMQQMDPYIQQQGFSQMNTHQGYAQPQQGGGLFNKQQPPLYDGMMPQQLALMNQMQQLQAARQQGGAGFYQNQDAGGFSQQLPYPAEPVPHFQQGSQNMGAVPGYPYQQPMMNQLPQASQPPAFLQQATAQFAMEQRPPAHSPIPEKTEPPGPEKVSPQLAYHAPAAPQPGSKQYQQRPARNHQEGIKQEISRVNRRLDRIEEQLGIRN